MKRRHLLIGFSAAMLAPQVAQAATIIVEKPWARATPGLGRITAIYLTLRNTGTRADRLVGLRSSQAGSVAVHQTTSVDGVMEMQAVEMLTIDAGKAVAMTPGGYHIMAVDLKGPLKAGDTLPLILDFAEAGSITVTVPVLKIGASGPEG